MKRKRLWLILVLLASFEAAYAQMEIQVSLTRASAAPFPTSAMAYYNNPMSYFSLVMTPIDGRAHDIFISMTLTSDATPTKIWTDDSHVGTMPKINIPSMGKKIGSTEFVQHFNRRLNTNLSETYRGVSDLTLPEGTYHICIYVHDYYDTSRVIGSSCMNFDICYSGLAPELTSPNLTPSASGYDKLIPSKKTNFSWTGVVSNCFEPNAFEYVIQFVEVYPGQNVKEAVDNNPVLTALDCGRRTFFTYDYQTNPYLRLDSGGVYAVIVEAVPADANRAVNISNDGKSQYMVFQWCGPNTTGLYGGSGGNSSGGSGSGGTVGNGDGVSDHRVTEKSNQSNVLATLIPPRILYPSRMTAIENTNMPLSIRVSPVSGDSVVKADYTLELYEFVGDTSISLSRQPLKQYTRNGIGAHNGENMELVQDWSEGLVEGSIYLLSIKADAEYRYNTTYHIKNVDFIDNFPEINRYDSVVGMTARSTLSSVSTFQWGVENNRFNIITPARIIRPYVQSNQQNSEVSKSELNVVVWEPALFDGDSSELIVYDLYIDEVNEAGAQMGRVYEKTGISGNQTNLGTAVNQLTVGHTYSMYVRARLYYESVGTSTSSVSQSVKFRLKSSASESSYSSESYPEYMRYMIEDGADESQLVWCKKEFYIDNYAEPTVELHGRTMMAPVEDNVKPVKENGSGDIVFFGIGGKDAKGNPRKISGRLGFKLGRSIEDPEGNSRKDKLILSTQLDMFTIDGELSQLPTGGWGGPVKVSVLDGVTSTMNVGFGTAKDANGEEYDWWYIYGAETYDKSQKVGSLEFAGFGGLFAYNMVLNNALYLRKTADELLKDTYRGIRFTPLKGSWVAKGAVHVMQEDKGLQDVLCAIVLSMENEHFSRMQLVCEPSRIQSQIVPSQRSIYVYEVNADSHNLQLLRLPAGMDVAYKYSGSYLEEETANIGMLTVNNAEYFSMPVSVNYFETWRRDGEPKWSMVEGDGMTGSEYNNGVIMQGETHSGGTCEVPNDFNLDKELQALLPKVTNKNCSQLNSRPTAKAVLVGENHTGGLLSLDMTTSADVKYSLVGNGNDGKSSALLSGSVNAMVDYNSWRGKVHVADATLFSEMQYTNPCYLAGPINLQYNALMGEGTDVKLSGHVGYANNDGDGLEYNGLFEKVKRDTKSPYSPMSFTTTMPLTYYQEGNISPVNEVLVSESDGVGNLKARLFCFVLNEDGSSASAKDLTTGRESEGTGVRYRYSPEKVVVESSNGCFTPDANNQVNISATIYEKRKGSGVYDDRMRNIFTGEEDIMMKSDAYAWANPLFKGVSKETNVDTVIWFATTKAPQTLANQVVFTWPYNGDPFVPANEIDSACYIFMKQNRDDLFAKGALEKDGKVLRVFLVNQEKGSAEAADCKYEYFPVGTADKNKVGDIPYIKVYMPKSLFRTKNDSKTYSPCEVSMYVVDTAEYNKAMEESRRDATFTGKNAHPIDICRSTGVSVYNLYFRLDHMYPTYKILMDTIAAEGAKQGIGYGADLVTIDRQNSIITSKLSTINLNRNYAFRNRSYIFDQYTPNDTLLYAEGVVLPPLAMLAVDGQKTVNDKYNDLIPEWIAVNESFYYQFAHLIHFQSRAKWLVLNGQNVLYDPSIKLSDISMLASPKLRVREAGDVFTSMNELDLSNALLNESTANATALYWYHEGTQMRDPQEWSMPSLLQVKSDLVNRVTASHFQTTSHIKSIAFVKKAPTIIIKDRVSPAVVQDNKMFASFFSQLHSYADWYFTLTDEGRASVKKSINKSNINHQTLSLSHTAFSMPKASLLTAYDSWADQQSRFKSRDYWFDNWLRSNAVDGYPGIKPIWISPWYNSNYTPDNTVAYRQANRRMTYRKYIANAYYLSCVKDESSFLNTVFGICNRMMTTTSEVPTFYHNASANVHIPISVPYNDLVKTYLMPGMSF